jgi:glyceraldehyde 3-phosphate dehydrogenase
MTMATRVAINGVGRVGRCTLRAAFEQGADIEWAAINDLMPTSTGAAKAVGLVIPSWPADCRASQCASPCPRRRWST